MLEFPPTDGQLPFVTQMQLFTIGTVVVVIISVVVSVDSVSVDVSVEDPL